MDYWNGVDKVVDKDGNEINYAAAVNLMDDELREDIAEELSPCSPQEFYDAYCEAHFARYGSEFTIDGSNGRDAEYEYYRGDEVVYSLDGEHYLLIQHSDEGVDYSIYDRDFKLMDGGVIDPPPPSLFAVRELIIDDNDLHPRKVVEMPPDEFHEMLSAAESARETAAQTKPSYLETPIYREMAIYAYEAGELDAYRASREANVACKEAIEAAISENFSNNHLSTEAAVTSVLAQFSPQRVRYVLANTIQRKEHDGRIHQSLKDWAKKNEVCPEYTDLFVVDKVNPGLLNLFADKVIQLGEKQRGFDIPNVLESLKRDVENGVLTLRDAAVQLHEAGATNYVLDESEAAKRLFGDRALTVLVIEPEKPPYAKSIAPGLTSLQQLVGGYIEATYPFDDPIALVCNEEGKMNGLPLNRVLRDDNGNPYDIVAGTFFLAGIDEEDFCSMSEEHIKKYNERFKTPEGFIRMADGIAVVPMTPTDDSGDKPRPKRRDHDSR